jgi:hypothetical protein
VERGGADSMNRATLESDMRDHPKWLALSPLAYRLGVRLVLWAIHHSRAGFVPDFVVKEYAGTRVMAKKLGDELSGCGKRFGKAGILDVCEGGFVVHDLLAADGSTSSPVAAERPMTKSEAGRLGGAKSVEARRSASGSASPKQPLVLRSETAEANGSASAGASALLDQAAPDLTYQDHSGSGSSGSESDPPIPPATANSQATPAASRASRDARKTAPPADLKVSDELLAFAKKKSWPEWWVRDRFDAFLGLAKAKGWRYVDWEAAARNFIANEIGYKRGPVELAHMAPRAGSSAPHDDAARRASAAAVEAAAKGTRGAA